MGCTRFITPCIYWELHSALVDTLNAEWSTTHSGLGWHTGHNGICGTACSSICYVYSRWGYVLFPTSFCCFVSLWPCYEQCIYIYVFQRYFTSTGESSDFPNSSKIILKDMGKFGWYHIITKTTKWESCTYLLGKWCTICICYRNIIGN